LLKFQLQSAAHQLIQRCQSADGKQNQLVTGSQVNWRQSESSVDKVDQLLAKWISWWQSGSAVDK
jgi:hypothetical protein